jgi:hypothetical protein
MHRTVGDFILDLADNSIEAQSTRLEIKILTSDDEITIRIIDNGTGMDTDLLERVKDPYYTDGKKHPGRRVGLGIPFLIQTVEQCRGSYSIESEPGKGTQLSFSFPVGHIDTPPLGDIGDTLSAVLVKPGEFEAVLEHRRTDGGRKRSYRILRSELIEALGEIESVASQRLVRQYLASHEEEIE